MDNYRLEKEKKKERRICFHPCNPVPTRHVWKNSPLSFPSLADAISDPPSYKLKFHYLEYQLCVTVNPNPTSPSQITLSIRPLIKPTPLTPSCLPVGSQFVKSIAKHSKTPRIPYWKKEKKKTPRFYVPETYNCVSSLSINLPYISKTRDVHTSTYPTYLPTYLPPYLVT